VVGTEPCTSFTGDDRSGFTPDKPGTNGNAAVVEVYDDGTATV